jgi:hypothetical protein
VFFRSALSSKNPNHFVKSYFGLSFKKIQVKTIRGGIMMAIFLYIGIYLSVTLALVWLITIAFNQFIE